MRLSTPLIIVAAIFAFSAQAQAADDAFVPVFGKVYCPSTFPCPSPNNREQMAAIEDKAFAIANNCVKRRFFNRSEENEFFEKRSGLNSNLCFDPKPGQKARSGLTLTPACCVKPVAGNPNVCQVSCSLEGRQ
ncbi:MAG: hypothetical protein EOM37_07530 [Proteobacteria bacterium]|nr:hypothetical protein [Pseudomonadota bacterium]